MASSALVASSFGESHAPRSANSSSLEKLRTFLRAELAPFPGRGEGTLRLVLAVTLALVFSLTVQIPSAAISIYMVFFIFRDDTASTTKIALAAMVALTLIVVVLLLVTKCFIDVNALRVPVVFALLWGSMYIVRIMVMGIIGKLFACVIVMYLMTADAIHHAEPITRSVMYMWPIIAIGVGAAVLVDWLWKRRPDDAIFKEGVSRLEAVREALEELGAAAPTPGRAGRLARVHALALGGSVRLQGLLNILGPTQSQSNSQRRVSRIAKRVDDLVAAVASAGSASQAALSADERFDLSAIATNLGRFAEQVKAGKLNAVLPPLHLAAAPGAHAAVARIARAYAALQDAEVGETSDRATPISAPPAAPAGPLVPDAFTNPEHWRYAVKTTIALAICYVFIESVDWLGTRTALFTCVITALTTLGASTEKQVLRASGLVLGGLLGIGVVVFGMPHMESIASLVLVVGAVTALAGWISLGSPRISYAGFQLALAFYLTTIQEFGPTTDLVAIRDRAAGIVIGTMVMAFVFRYLWPVHAREILARQLPVGIADLAALARTSPPRSPAAAATARFAQVEEFLVEGALEPESRKPMLPAFESMTTVAHDSEAVLFALRLSPSDATRVATELDALSHQLGAANASSTGATNTFDAHHDSDLVDPIRSLKQSVLAAQKSIRAPDGWSDSSSPA